MTSAGHPVPPWPARRPAARVPLSLGAPGRVTDAPESRHGAVDAVGPLPSSDEENPGSHARERHSVGGSDEPGQHRR